MITTLAICLMLTGQAREQPAPRLAVIRHAPNFALINQDGQPVKLADYKGKVVLVSFIFTTCSGSCPATTHRMAKVAELAKTRQEVDEHLADKQVRAPQLYSMEFLSITLDPERDNPEALRQYIKLFDLPTDREVSTRHVAPGYSGTAWAMKTSRFRWTFATGDPAMVNKVIDAWGMWVKAMPNGQLDHPSRIFLVDQESRIREIYNVDLLRPAEVLDDIAELLKDNKSK